MEGDDQNQGTPATADDSTAGDIGSGQPSEPVDEAPDAGGDTPAPGGGIGDVPADAPSASEEPASSPEEAPAGGDETPDAAA